MQETGIPFEPSKGFLIFSLSFGLEEQAHLSPKDLPCSSTPIIIMYLSGLKMMEGMLNTEQWLRFPPKPYDAKAK